MLCPKQLTIEKERFYNEKDNDKSNRLISFKSEYVKMCNLQIERLARSPHICFLYTISK